MVGPYAAINPIAVGNQRRPSNTGYVTNAIEALNAKLRRPVKIRGHFPTDEAATKLTYHVLRQTAGEWKTPPRDWSQAKTQFAIMFEDRFLA